MTEHITQWGDRLEIADALYRFAAGIDEGDGELVGSAFTEDAVFLRARPGEDLGLVKDYSKVSTRAAIVTMTLQFRAKLDTMHVLSNLRVAVSGDTATATCYAVAYHYLLGQGALSDHNRSLVRGNRYQARLVKDKNGDFLWRIAELTISNIWSDGDVTVMSG